MQPYGINLKFNIPYIQNANGLLRFDAGANIGIFSDSTFFYNESIFTGTKENHIGTVGFGFRMSLM